MSKAQPPGQYQGQLRWATVDGSSRPWLIVQAEILNLLTRLRRDHGLTMLMVSHDLAVIAHICDRIGVMHSGRLLEMTTAAALAAGHVTDPYSQQLLRANQGFDASGGIAEVTA